MHGSFVVPHTLGQTVQICSESYMGWFDATVLVSAHLPACSPLPAVTDSVSVTISLCASGIFLLCSSCVNHASAVRHVNGILVHLHASCCPHVLPRIRPCSTLLPSRSFHPPRGGRAGHEAELAVTCGLQSHGDAPSRSPLSFPLGETDKVCQRRRERALGRSRGRAETKTLVLF